MRLLLLRHGAAEGQHHYLGVTDAPLSPEGCTQALCRRAILPPVEALWSSPLTRCRETAALLWPDVPPTVLEDLRELDFGAWEGRTWAEVGDEAVYDRWLAEDPRACFPGGETLGDFCVRVNRAFSAICTRCAQEAISTAAVVTHSGVLCALLSTRVGGGYFDWHCPPCGGYAALLRPESGKMERVTPLGEAAPW